MGDRVNFVLKDDDMAVVLYAHWGYTSRYTELADAIRHAEPRWGDGFYCARMIISHLLKHDIDGENGFGLSAMPTSQVHYYTGDPCVVVDLVALIVDVDGLQIPFSTFAEMSAQVTI